VLALIAGGGIAGSTTGIALAKAGIRAEIFEAYAHDAEGVGAWLTFASNGVDALATLGLGEALGACGFPTTRMRMFSHTGRHLAEFPFGSPRPDGLQVHSVRRADLYRVLRDTAVQRGVPVHHGKRLVGVEPQRRGVRALFADGSHADGDVLIGADGLRSAVRDLIDPRAPRARYSGLLNTGGFARSGSLPARFDGEPGTMNFRFGRRCFLGHVTDPDGTTWWFANPPSARELSRDELAAMSEDAWRRRLLELFDGDEVPAAELVEGSPHVFAGWNTYDFPSVPHWHRASMVIIGDAAHATSPAAGQGASMAVEDAVTLARALRDESDVDGALRRYEDERRDRVERVVRLGERNGSGKAAGPITRLVRDRIVLPLASARFSRRHDHPEAWLFDHHVAWEPVASSTPP
jgi:2-polyprenyl-6-methoxyphenol hydroxylase-like FAD-dependent oxidoreductase